MGIPRLIAALGVVAVSVTSAHAIRPDSPQASQLTFKFDVDDVVESYADPGGRVRVFFTRAGPNAVRAADGDGDGVPDDVALVGATYEEVLTFYEGEGFRLPLDDSGTPGGDGGDGRFDVYLVDFGLAADGTFIAERCSSAPTETCSGYMVQENDFKSYGYPSFRYATRVLASHETFHAVQAAYDARQGANWSEATAVWATEQFDATLSDFEGFVDGWLSQAERSIDEDPTGPVASYAYGLSIVAEYFSEAIAPSFIRAVWEHSVNGADGVADPHWSDVIGALLDARGESFAARWTELGRWALHAGYDAQPAGSTWAAAAHFPPLTALDETLPFTDDKLRVFHASLRAYTFAPGARDTVRVELATAPADAAELDGMVVLIASYDGDTITLAGSSPGEPAAAEVDARGADQVVVAVLNTALTGESQRPGICVGAPAEVAACQATFVPVEVEPEPEPEPDPVVEPVVTEDSDASETGAVVEATHQRDDGCHGAPAPLVLVGLALALVLSRSRARAAATTSVASRCAAR